MPGTPLTRYTVPTPVAIAIEPADSAAQIALLERRLARAEAARAAAEDLLEQKSRVLAAANTELTARKESLSTSLERRTRQLLDAQRVAGFGTMLWDIRSRQLELSPQVQVMIGLEPGSAVKTYRSLVRRLLREDRRRMLHWMNRELLAGLTNGRCERCEGRADQAQTGSCEESLREYRIEVRCPNGDVGDDVRSLCVMAQFQIDSQCRPVMIFVTVQDITRQVRADNEAATLRARELQRLQDLEKLNEELLIAREQADIANDAKSRFLAMMSHDIRTPLNGVIGMLSLFDESTLTAEQKRTLALVRSSGDQLRVLLNDIIDLARAEAGKLTLSPGPTNLVDVLTDGADFWRHLATEKSLSLEIVLARDTPCWIDADSVRLRQLIDNMLSNAIKYTSEGGVMLKTRVLPQRRLRIEVVDTGIGIPAHRRAELFTDFSQLNLLGSEPGGAGLGLAICQRIIEVMGGTLGVDDAGRGSCFWFEIPVAEIPVPKRVANPVVRSFAGPDGRTPRVLVAEDLATNRIVIEGCLRKLGCEVRVVEDGQQALTAVESGDAYDLVLMDMAMPVMDGPEATRRIRALQGALCDLPIIALTAFTRPEELAPMMAAGANDSVAKPIVIEDLYRAMSKALAFPVASGNAHRFINSSH
ncbi:ATP-binding protein [Novosphingobium sp. FKTRR1]|uniref:ATP-binding protein n=1 Tax=Novosphingobium sp. FKTRR1 TaxID=2879118 RepID=UPI001CEFDB23|nr:ATP-binding protein [Novosphingobium sp. FKTRR1]